MKELQSVGIAAKWIESTEKLAVSMGRQDVAESCRQTAAKLPHTKREDIIKKTRSN